MKEKISYTGITKESGYLYFLDRKGDVSRSKMSAGSNNTSEFVATAGVNREAGWLYFIDSDGDVSRVAMNRGGKKPVSVRTKSEAKSSSVNKTASDPELMDKLKTGKLKPAGFGLFADSKTGEIVAKMQDGILVLVS